MKRACTIITFVLLGVSCRSVQPREAARVHKYNDILESETRTIDTHAQDWELYLTARGERKLCMKAFIVDGRINGFVPTLIHGDVSSHQSPTRFHHANPWSSIAVTLTPRGAHTHERELNEDNMALLVRLFPKRYGREQMHFYLMIEPLVEFNVLHSFLSSLVTATNDFFLSTSVYSPTDEDN